MGSSSLSVFVNFLINNTTNVSRHFEYSVSTNFLWFFGIILVYGALMLVIKTCRHVSETYAESASFLKLYKAAERDDIMTAMGILNRHPDYVNRFKQPEGYTPFMVACAKANTQMVKYMLSKGANVRMKSKNNETPFHLAVFFCIMHKHYKNATCIRELFYAGANINEPGRNDATPLQMAAIFGHVPLIKWLLSKNADLRVRPDPYLLALSQGHHDAANFIASVKTIKSIEYEK